MAQEKVKYKLINNDTGEILWLSDGAHSNNPAPKNWDNAEQTLKRSTKTFGVYTELSKNLEFTKKGKTFLLNALSNKDIEADVTLEEYKLHPTLEYWYVHSTGTFDLSGYSYEKNTFKAPFKSGGLNSTIQAYLKEEFELQRTESINGKTLEELQLKDVVLDGRDIFLVSKLETSSERKKDFSELVQNLDFRVQRGFTPELEITSNRDSGNINQVVLNPISESVEDQINISYFSYTPESSKAFYLQSDVAKTLQITVKGITKTYNDTHILNSTTNKGFKVSIRRYSWNGSSHNYEDETLVFEDTADQTTEEKLHTYENTVSVSLDQSDSLFLSVEQDILSTNLSTDVVRIFKYDDIECSVTITEESSREQSQSKAILEHEAGDRLMQIITGETNRYYSSFYGRVEIGYEQDGEFSRTALTNGFYIRQFFDKKLSFSLENFLNTSNVIHATGYGIEKINGLETLVHEDLKYFFQDQVAIRLPNQVSNIKRKPAKEFYNSTLTFGYKKPEKDRQYDEAMGLDEFNTKSSYTTGLTRVETTFKKESDARADKYGQEFARRKPKLNFPEQDTRYDRDIHILDLKVGLGMSLEERKWQDDFETEPLGVFSPETASNLRLTPREINNRWQWFYGASLQKFQNEKVRYSNSSGNSDLATKKTGEEIQYESGDINVSDLEQARFYPQWIEFDYEVDFFVNEQVYGTTDVNGRNIPNYYFKIEFINENNNKEYGYLFELKPNKEGKWKVLKAL
ncbi:hypothetical protein [uncultured Winogradskyella sp.]|uniref:hypothetical protein n=1 Tax=uncultured Winogradskyella sp. TaxID=395353 RepID=UPI00261DFADB|nr:hypothetical protein [uncultured Winogradskyella sp.]